MTILVAIAHSERGLGRLLSREMGEKGGADQRSA